MLQSPPFNAQRNDRDYPERQARIQALTSVLKGRQYDGLRYDFQTEYTPNGEYVPLKMRRPSVRFNICKTVVDDSVSMLFSEGHFPTVHAESDDLREALAAITKEARLNEVMIEAATIGSVGSVAIQFLVLRERVFFRALNTQFMTPTFDDFAPDTLVKVREQYKTRGAELSAKGYDIADDELNTVFWFAREWDEQEERFYLPRKAGDSDAKWIVDTKRTMSHGLGFVPMVWVKNLPGGEDCDGACTFEPAIETSIEIDYQLSQAGRGLRYSSDPKLVIKDPSGVDQNNLVGGVGNALIVSHDGDAKLLEINGHAASAVVDYVKCLRELAIESMHGNRVSPEKMASAQSGKAMELMNQGLIWLADRLRISYGEGALLTLYKMIVMASQSMKIKAAGLPVGKLPEEPLSLSWNDWYDKTSTDNLQDAQTLQVLISAGLMSRDTAIRAISDEYDIEDVDAEVAKIDLDMLAAQEASSDGSGPEDQAAPPQQ